MSFAAYSRWAATLTLMGACFCADRDDLARADRLQRQGSLKEARAIYEPLVLRLQHAGNSATLADALRKLSEVDLAEGRYADAMRDGARCGSLAHELTLPVPEVDCLSVTGRAQVFSGDYPAALATHERALAIASANKLSEDENALLNNIGGIHFFLGRYGDAYRSYRDAQLRLKGHEKEAWYGRRQRITLANLASLYQGLGQYQRSLETYAQVRAVAGDMRPAEQAIMLANMGTLYRRLGDPVKAIQNYGQAQHLFATGRHRDGEIGVVRNVGIALGLDMGDLPGALSQFKTALAMSAESGNRLQAVQAHLYMGETLWRMHNPSEAAEHFETALKGAQDLASSEDRWNAIYGLGRILEKSGDTRQALERYQAAIAVIESMRSGIGARSLQAGFLADKRDVYDSAISLLLELPDVPAGRVLRFIEGAKARAFQDRVKKNPGKGATIESIAAKLDHTTVLLDFWTGTDKAAVIWIAKGGSGIARLKAPGNAELESYADQLINGTGDSWRAAAGRIADQLLSPIAAQLAGAKQVIIVPDGALQRIPFETLPLSNERGSGLLIEKLAVSYLPSVAGLENGNSRIARSWFAPWRKELVAFADPEMRGPPSDSLVESELIGLPASREEVRAIANILGGRPEIHSGTDDLKRYVNGSLSQGTPILHLSTHAVADPDDPDRSRIVFSPDPRNPGSEYLFTREISGLDLREVRLATLAACETEGGKWTAGEGVQSFSRAFLEAGTASVVTTLWRIGDRSTAEFMKRFYTRLANGDPVNQALRNAKLAFYRSNSIASHPKYWAVFVLNGDTRTTAPITIPWTVVAAVAAFGLAGLGFAIGKNRRCLSHSRTPG